MKKLGLALTLAACLGFAPAQAQQVYVPGTMATVSITGTVAARATIIPGIAGKSIYITQILLAPVDTSTVTFSAGTGTNCGSNTTALTGAMAFTGVGAISAGSGYGAVLVAPKGYDVCITIGTAAAPGSIAYAQF